MTGTFANVARSVGLRRHHVAHVRTWSQRHSLRVLGPERPAPRGRTLCYHSVGQPSWGVHDVRPEQFRRQIEVASSMQMRFVPASEVAAGRAGPGDLALTFDDALASVTHQVLPYLSANAIPWTVFVVTDWADGRSEWPAGTFMAWRDVELAAASGAEIGSHSVTHPDLSKVSTAQMYDELGRSKEVIERRTGASVTSLAVPFGSHRSWTVEAAEAAAELGYTTIHVGSTHARNPSGRTVVTRYDTERCFGALIAGRYDRHERQA